MEGSPEAFRAICDYHASGGTTSLLLTTATAPIADRRGCATAQTSRLSCRRSGCPRRRSIISRSRAGAQSPKQFEIRIRLIESLLDCGDVIKRVPWLRNTRRNGGNRSPPRWKIAVSGGHSDAWEEEARTAFEHGMHSVTHTSIACRPRAGGCVSRRGLLELALIEPEIACELIADGHHVSTTLMSCLSSERCGGDLSRDRCDCGAGLPENSGSHWRRGACGGWRLLARRSLGPGRKRSAHDRSDQDDGQEVAVPFA